jgi:hypothetical protein
LTKAAFAKDAILTDEIETSADENNTSYSVSEVDFGESAQSWPWAVLAGTAYIGLGISKYILERVIN